jgi:hypothetical protein
VRRSLFLLLVLVLAGCGGSTDEPSAPATQAQPAAPEPIGTLEGMPGPEFDLSAECRSAAPDATVVIAGKTVPFAVICARQDERDAKSNVRAAVVAAETYFTANQTYAGLTSAVLRAVDPTLKNVTVGVADARTYCLQSTVGSTTVSKSGPAADLIGAPCS